MRGEDDADGEVGVDVIESGGRRETWKIVEDLIQCLGAHVSDFPFLAQSKADSSIPHTSSSLSVDVVVVARRFAICVASHRVRCHLLE
jgi:hypothetical protein